MRIRRIAIAIAIASLGLPPAPVFAQSAPPSSAQATDLKARGDAAMDALRYDEAIALYTQAYEAGHDPAVLYNRGRVQQARGDYPKALDDFERFDREAPAALKARVPKLAELLAEVRSHVATLVVRADVDGARVLVRGAVVGTTPLAPLKLNAGPATIEVIAEGYTPVRRDVALQGGGSNSVELMLAAKAHQGTLSVTAEGPAGVVVVDGERLGLTPVEVVRDAGTHKIVLEREGQSPVETSAVVEVGAKKSVSFPAPKSDAVTGKWWFWTAAGVVVLGGAATVFALTREKSPDNGETFAPGRVSAPLMRW